MPRDRHNEIEKLYLIKKDFRQNTFYNDRIHVDLCTIYMCIFMNYIDDTCMRIFWVHRESNQRLKSARVTELK